MFTGLVEARGTLARRDARGPGFRIEVESELGPFELGESVSVSGVCLTVAACSARGFAADVSTETAQRTTLGRLALGAAVNLERSLAVGDRLGGHWVSGHVDAVVPCRRVTPAGEARAVRVAFPPELGALIAVKGSIALDGVSLTVNALDAEDFEIMLIPHTCQVTTLGALVPGTLLNLEVDMLARYAVRYLDAELAGQRGGAAFGVGSGRSTP